MNANERAAHLAEREFVALCRQAAAAQERESARKQPERLKADFYSHYLRPVEPVTRTKATVADPRYSKPSTTGRTRHKLFEKPRTKPMADGLIVRGSLSAKHGQNGAKSGFKAVLKADTRRTRRKNRRDSSRLERNS